LINQIRVATSLSGIAAGLSLIWSTSYLTTWGSHPMTTHVSATGHAVSTTSAVSTRSSAPADTGSADAFTTMTSMALRLSKCTFKSYIGFGENGFDLGVI
ncbi:MAG: hypothetical protein Q9183_006007, partial [Haloplaca sp. 2 TL-2023]